MKRNSIVAAGLFIGIGIFFVNTEFSQQPEISTVLSDRSKEYLAQEKEGSALGKMYLGEKEALQVGKEVDVDGCFSLVIPFALKTERRDKKCDFYMAIEKPKGSITAYLNTESSASWDNVPGVSMRKQSTWTYEEIPLTVDGREFLTFKEKEENRYHRSAFFRTSNYFLVINLEAHTSDNLDAKFEAMLKSVKIN